MNTSSDEKLFNHICDNVIGATTGTTLSAALDYQGIKGFLSLIQTPIDDLVSWKYLPEGIHDHSEAIPIYRTDITTLHHFLNYIMKLDTNHMNNMGTPVPNDDLFLLSKTEFDDYCRVINASTNATITTTTGTKYYGITNGSASTTVHDGTKRVEYKSTHYPEKVVAHTYDVNDAVDVNYESDSMNTESFPVLQPKEYYTCTNQKNYLQLDYDSELVWKHEHNNNATKDALLLKYLTDVPYNPNEWKGRTIQLYLNPSECKCTLYPVIEEKGEHKMVVRKLIGECCAY